MTVHQEDYNTSSDFTFSDTDEIEIDSGELKIKELSFQEDLVFYFKCNEGSYDNSADELIDDSGNGYHGQGSGTPGSTTNGAFDKAATFNGSSQYFTIDNPSTMGLDFATSYTIMAWARTSVSTRGVVLGFGRTTTGTPYCLLDFNSLAGTGTVSFSTRDDGGVAANGRTGDVSCNDGDWHLIVGVHDASAQRQYTYFDGTLEDTRTPNRTGDVFTIDDSRIGAARFGGSTLYFNGDVDIVAGWSRVLTSAEITELYNSFTNPGDALEFAQYPETEPYAVKTTGYTDPDVVNFTTFTETTGTGHAGSVKYKLSTDGTTWQYWNGSAWTTGSLANSVATVNTNIGDFDPAEETGSITSFEDYSLTVAGTVKANDTAHGLNTGDVIRIDGTNDYDGQHTITVIDANSFYFTETWVATDTGTWNADRIYVKVILDSDGTQNVVLTQNQIGFNENQFPIVDAGTNKSLFDNTSGTPFSDCSFSDPDGTIVSAWYKVDGEVDTWTQIPQGGYGTLLEAVQAFSYVFDTVGSITVRLRVIDDGGAEASDSLTMTVNKYTVTINVLDAEDNSHISGVIFNPDDGTASTTENSPFTHEYEFGSFTPTFAKVNFQMKELPILVDNDGENFTITIGQPLTDADLGDIADAVWDEDITTHTTADSAGRELTRAKTNAANAFAVSI